MGKWNKAVWGMLAAAPLVAQAQVDLRQLDRDMAGPKSKVMVLGTMHLSGLPASFNQASLNGLIDKLAA